MNNGFGSDNHDYKLIKPTPILTIGKRYRVSTILNSLKEYSFTLDLTEFINLGYGITKDTILIFGYFCKDSLSYKLFRDPHRHLFLCTPRLAIYDWGDDGFSFVVNDWLKWVKNIDSV
jgi:hypothetical protein